MTHRTLSVRQVAEETGLSLDAVYRLVSSGRLRSIRLTPRGRYVVPEEALAALLGGASAVHKMPRHAGALLSGDAAGTVFD
jgi:excisionase family DNA binding protein